MQGPFNDMEIDGSRSVPALIFFAQGLVFILDLVVYFFVDVHMSARGSTRLHLHTLLLSLLFRNPLHERLNIISRHLEPVHLVLGRFRVFLDPSTPALVDTVEGYKRPTHDHER